MESNFSIRYKVVLCRPADNKNIGSVARAMRNLGFNNLVLANPESYLPEEAKVSACHSEQILENCKITNSLQEALKDSDHVIGFSARNSADRFGTMTLSGALSHLQSYSYSKIALVFGNERDGLSLNELSLCRHIVTLPSVGMASYNLAQAVLIALYEIVRSTDSQSPVEQVEASASWEHYQALDNLLMNLAKESKFFKVGSSAKVPVLLPGILRRLDLTEREVKILIGIASNIQKRLNRETSS